MKFKIVLLAAKINIREKFNHILGPIRRRRLMNPYFTIFSNNCWGGHVYRYFAMPYNTPTVGMYIFSDDYVKFLSDPRRYLSKDLVFISIDDSKYSKVLRERNTSCPIGRLGDVEIVFLHYKSREEAYSKWNRRKERINWNHIVVKMSQQNLCTLKAMQNFDMLPYTQKVILTTKDYGLKCQLIRSDYSGQEEISNDTNSFRKGINLVKFINGNADFKK